MKINAIQGRQRIGVFHGMDFIQYNQNTFTLSHKITIGKNNEVYRKAKTFVQLIVQMFSPDKPVRN